MWNSFGMSRELRFIPWSTFTGAEFTVSRGSVVPLLLILFEFFLLIAVEIEVLIPR